jgi:hypothetical protein
MPQIYEQATGLWALQADDGSIQTFDTEQEARMAAQQTAAQAFEEIHGTMRADAQALLRKADAINDLLTANPQVAAAAQAAEPGALIGSTGMVREEVLMGIALIASFRAYATTELAPGITVRNAVYRLG